MNLDLTKCHCDGAGFCEIYHRQMDAAGVGWCKRTSKEKRENYKKINNPYRTDLKKKKRSNYINPTNFYDELPKQKNDIAICTIPANDIAMEQLNVTRKSIKSYAKKCGADYIELSGDQCPEFPMYNKYRLHQVTSKYEKTLYLDCDIIVKKKCTNLFDLTPNDKFSVFNQADILEENNRIKNVHVGMRERTNEIAKLFQVKDYKYRQPNGGVLVIPKSLQDVYKQPNGPYPKDWCFDQYYLSVQLNDENFNDLSPIYNWEFIRHDFWEGLEDAHIIHLDGSRPFKYRMDLLNRMVSGDYRYFRPPLQEEYSGHDYWRPVWF